MPRPIIALLTDFGLRDHYVGTMKAVALGVCPDATFVDITHEVPPQDVLGAVLQLSASFRFFPASSTFLVVVDPGVGSARRAIAVEAFGYRFVGPDNGVLTPALAGGEARAVELTNRAFARAVVSRTFEGRDRFAPAAAALASGEALASLGSALSNPVVLTMPAPRTEGATLMGEVLTVDRFGNLITNIDRHALEQFAAGRAIAVEIAGRGAGALVDTYAAAPSGGLCALVGSSDHLEIAVNGGSAAVVLEAGRGAPVHLRRGA